MRRLGLWLALVIPGMAHAQVPAWKKPLERQLAELDAEYAGQVGVHLRDLQSGEEYSLRGDEKWYVASGVKLPVAIEVFRQIEAGKLTLKSKIKPLESDYCDGAGATNFAAPGTAISVEELLEQMLIHSDNTAADVLIRKVGLDKVNSLAKGFGFGRITTLSDVRRHLYGTLHPLGKKLTGTELLKLGKLRGDRERTELLESLFGAPASTWKRKDIESAYHVYYAGGANSAPLKAYSRLLEALVNGSLLKSESTLKLLALMERAETGVNRIKGGLPDGLVFAHKTGTQRKRVCDFGIIRRGGVNLALVSACVRGVRSTSEAEKVLARVGRAIASSGLIPVLTEVAGE